MLVPSAVLVVACLLVGMLPAQTVGPLLHIAARSILGAALPTYELAVWHGFTLPLMMSLVALSGGVLFYAGLARTGRTMAPTPLLSRWNAARIFDIANVALIRGAGRLTRVLFPSRLQPQLLLILCAALLAGCLPLYLHGLVMRDRRRSRRSIRCLRLLWLAGGTCAIGAALQAKFHRLAALIMVGGVGLVTCLTFAWFSAPDLALTQIAVEVVTLVLILLGIALAAEAARFRRAPPQIRCAPELGAPAICSSCGRRRWDAPHWRSLC